jgi:hypothetical protein
LGRNEVEERRKGGGKGGRGVCVTDHELVLQRLKPRTGTCNVDVAAEATPTKTLEISDRQEQAEGIKAVKVLEEAKEAEEAKELAC